jgi:hypothetical protein
MDRRRTDTEVPLHFMFCWRYAMDLGVLVDEREIPSLLLGELGFFLPPAVIWAEDIHHLPALKDNDVLLGSVMACFDQPLPFFYALVLELTDSVFREVQLVATVASGSQMQTYGDWSCAVAAGVSPQGAIGHRQRVLAGEAVRFQAGMGEAGRHTATIC